MTLLLNLIGAGALIAAFMLLRIATDQGILRQRLRAGQDCGESRCYGACHNHEDDTQMHDRPEDTTEPMNRSADHAPQ
ncbi:MAG: hypothetical protein OEW35_20580 [Gammaproteobacteria bacterium]|nr:hypothetical protein [Gammaproteobacteria bacterium]MDH4256220.1 hypothetical protein [Gammaproteobacteria bacterium]MDH5262792.1 hypothetical protein [Gammaproteobacteria bacterium]